VDAGWPNRRGGRRYASRCLAFRRDSHVAPSGVAGPPTKWFNTLTHDSLCSSGAPILVLERVETIQVVFDAELLRATEVAAPRTKLNRSALIRDARRAYLKKLEIREWELRDRKGALVA